MLRSALMVSLGSVLSKTDNEHTSHSRLLVDSLCPDFLLRKSVAVMSTSSHAPRLPTSTSNSSGQMSGCVSSKYFFSLGLRTSKCRQKTPIAVWKSLQLHFILPQCTLAFLARATSWIIHRLVNLILISIQGLKVGIRTYQLQRRSSNRLAQDLMCVSSFNSSPSVFSLMTSGMNFIARSEQELPSASHPSQMLTL